MTEEEIEQLKSYEWDKFCRRYPYITGKTWLSKLMVVFNPKDIAYQLWENGFLQGWLACKKEDQDE